MRERTKREILELLDTVNEAFFHLLTAKEAAAGSLLSDCCAAIAAIDRAFAEDGDAHALLRKKLRRLAAALETAAQREVALGQAEVLALAKELKQLRRKIAGMRARLEIVFLPYKASMWDSLESIWRAAAADPDCDAYVVPIPYYDLHPDHTAAKFHYEGGLYPEDVPITDYRAYDLATRCPDVIYIHNPYDGCNRVTSVDPAYYSERLKQYTEMLVYVPYFVVAGDKISEHFCQTPGVYHADRVIVQSEAIKKTYAKFIPEEKILALGSPKFDKVAWMMAHPPAMPREWAEIARGRKLVLYNTHLSPLIVDDGSVCRKLRYVFSVFEEREDVCLLWRPHPLSEATMQSMNPKPLKEYIQLVEMFKEKKAGIFDDSSDVHRAIALSSGYYGDPSSLVAMYYLTGKPIMIQELLITEKVNQDKLRISFSSGVIEDDTMWFSTDFFNGLFQMDMHTGKTLFLGVFPVDNFQAWPYSKIIKIKNKLFFVPSMACEIAEFDLNTQKFSLYPLNEEKIPGRFRTGFLYEDNIYMIPDIGDSILRFNIINHQIHYCFAWSESLAKYVKEKDMSIFSDAIRVGDDIWCPFRQGNRVVKIELKTLTSRVYEVGDKENNYFSITYENDEFWLITDSGNRIVRWNHKNNTEKEYRGILNRTKDGMKVNEKLGFCLFKNHAIWIFPRSGVKILKFNPETECVEKSYCLKNHSCKVENFKKSYFGILEWENMIIGLPGPKSEMILVNENGITEINPLMDESDIYNCFMKKTCENNYSLCLYLKNIANEMFHLVFNERKIGKRNGRNIYLTCKREMGKIL